MSVLESIEGFCSYFEQQSLVIAHLTVPPGVADADTGAGSEFRYRKALFVMAIDTLAGLRFNKTAYPQLFRQNRDRFIRFVKEYAAWNDGYLVSLPFLKDQLADLKTLDRPLGKCVSDKLAGFSIDDGGSIKASQMDAPLCELIGRATTEREEQAVHDYQHFALLYRYRNSLVHESREPGTGMEVFASTGDPYYHGYINDPKWYLVYPTSLFQVLLTRAILTRAIAGFRAYLVENSLDPYALVEDKARW